MPTVSHASYCCAKDRERARENYISHLKSHRYDFSEAYQIFQRCEPFLLIDGVTPIEIRDEDYPEIMDSIGVPFPDERYGELTHGWGGPHYYAHHIVNLVKAAQTANTDYIVLADCDCYIKDQPENHTWIDEGIKLLESRPDLFLISPSDGGPERLEHIMSQQMFLIDRIKFLKMDWIPWDGTFIDGGPFQEFYALTEGFVYRHMKKNKLWRYVLGQQYRAWHEAWH